MEHRSSARVHLRHDALRRFAGIRPTLRPAFPLAMRKAFGRPAGLAAMTLTLVAIAGVLALPDLRGEQASPLGALAPLAEHGAFPVMVVLGPLMLLQYFCWLRL